MPEVNLAATLEAAEKKFNIGKGSDKLKFKEGENRIRILSESVALQSTFKDNTSVKFVTWVWDYLDSKLKLAFLPVTVYRGLANLQKKADYAFSEVPMPYDILVDAVNAGTKEVEYSVNAARANSPVPQEAIDALGKEKPIAEVVALIKALQDTSDNSSGLPV